MAGEEPGTWGGWSRESRFLDAFDEIADIVKDGGLSEPEQARYLGMPCTCVAPRLPNYSIMSKPTPSAPFVHPMFALCALTGCRRSEAIRTRKRDVDFKSGNVTIREKKRDHTQDYTTRDVPMNARLVSVMRAWLATHPGGQHLIAGEDGLPITIRSGRLEREFSASLTGSRFKVLPGWHALRHSFASILASKRGTTSRRAIVRSAGCLDEKTVDRYRHLYRETGREAVEPRLA